MCSFFLQRFLDKKKTDDLTVFLPFWGSLTVKAACKHVGEIDPWY